MVNIVRRIAGWLGLNRASALPWPGMDIELPRERRLHMVGSIHMGTRQMCPLPASLMSRLENCSALVVEADITHTAALNACPAADRPLDQRLSADHYATVVQLCQEYSLNISQLDALPAWHVALLLQARQAGQLGLRTDYGIDYQLIQAARSLDKPVIELEGPDQQLALLQQLPDQGVDLLQDTLDHWHTNARLLQVMIGWWLQSRPVNVQQAFPPTFSGDLYATLMTERNLRWKTTLQDLPAGRYVVAVGALHLYGADNLPSLLAS